MKGSFSETLRGSVAIVGQSCRFPGGVKTPAQLWKFALSNGEAVSVIFQRAAGVTVLLRTKTRE